MSSGGKSKAGSGGGGDVAKRRKVGFAGDAGPISCNANECLKLHIVFAGQEPQGDDDGEEEYTFDPEFSERIFGEDGKIYGYKGLKIDLWLHATTFQAYVQIRCDSKSTGGKNRSTDVLAKLKEVFGDGLTEDRDAFFQSLLGYSQEFEQMLKEHGEVISSWRSGSSSASASNGHTEAGSNGGTSQNLRQIVRMELRDPTVRTWHARLTPLSLLFIDGAQPIESDDPLWEVYLGLEGEGPHMKVVGYCNVYRFYHYPDSTRLRISQILVLPPYQGQGFGLHLLKIVNTTASERSCYDVTMEEPSMTLQKLRDTMDVLRLLSLPSLSTAIEDALKKLQSHKQSIFSGKMTEISAQSTRKGVKEKSILVPPVNLTEEVRKQLQLSKMQFRRCWEQILFLHVDPMDKALQDVFQEALVQRLNLEIFEKENERKSVGKQVIDTENEFDSSKTFVMMQARKTTTTSAGSSSNVAPEESNGNGDLSACVPAAEEKVKVLQEELKERETELLAVAQDVMRHCKPLGLNIPLFRNWEQGHLDKSNS